MTTPAPAASAREPGPTDDAIMGTPEEAKAKLMAATAKYREYRQPLIASAAEHKARESREREARFRLAEAAMLWLWHEERPAPAEPPAQLRVGHGEEGVE